ncbi:MAG TPA: hypothetical protein VG963_05165 [Polyangiaceae bacterium]|nr:hypothetical protein [Polyangiaceae bacterium]HVZ31793.1 hypothetical protein [Polyangiaceae bacterium]
MTNVPRRGARLFTIAGRGPLPSGLGFGFETLAHLGDLALLADLHALRPRAHVRTAEMAASID